MNRCTCPADRLGRFWRVIYPDRPRVSVHVACGRVREIRRARRPLTVLDAVTPQS